MLRSNVPKFSLWAVSRGCLSPESSGGTEDKEGGKGWEGSSGVMEVMVHGSVRL